MADTFDPMTARLEDAPSTAKKDEFDPSTATLEKPRTWGEAAKDTGAAVMGGLAGLVKTGGDLYGLASGNMDNAASELGRNAQEYWSDAKSQALQTKIAQRKANIDAQESTLGKVWTAVKDTLTDPALAADTVAENVATMLPGAGVGRVVGAAKYARGFQAASEFGPASLAAREAIAKQAGKYATGAAIGTGAVQQGADVSGDIYGDLMKKTDAEWDASPDFQSALQRHGGDRQAAKSELANATARAAFLPAAGISVAANAIPGATYLERALVGAPLRTGAKEVGRFGAARGFARGVLGEGGQEFVEEGGGRLGANLAAQQQAMPGHDTWDGVGENAGMGFAGGALLGVGGGVHGAREAMAQKRAQGQAKQNQPAKDDGTQSDVPTGMPPDASGGGAAPVEDAGNAGLSAPLGSGVTPDMLVPANPLLDAMRQRATDPGVIAPPINKDEIFDQSAATPVAGELYQPGDTTNPLTGERITAKPSEAMGINPADGPLSTGAAIAVDTGASGQMQQAAALPAPISLEEADAHDRAAYEQFFASADAEPVVARYFENDDDIPDFDAASNVSDEDFLRALGATDEDIQDAIATARQPASPQSRPAVDAGAQANEPAGTGQGAGADQAAQGQVAPRQPSNFTGTPTATMGQQGATARPGPGFGLKDALAQIRAKKQQEAANAKAATSEAAPAAAALPAARTGAVEAAGVEQQGPGADAGNGFKQGPKKGERYRVGVSVATGGVTLEKRLPAGTAATFYVGKDGGLVDADDVNLVGTKDREKLWTPTTPEQASQATAILDEMGRLDLTDPKRKDAKARLKALVTATAAMDSAGAAGSAPDIKAITAKQIPDMTDGELQAAIAHYGPENKRTAKLQKEVQRRAGAPSSATTEGTANVPQTAQAKQAVAQPAQAGRPQAGAATATASTSPAGGNRVQAAGLTNGAPTANPGAQAATAAGAQAQAQGSEVEALRQQLRDVEDRIIATAPSAMGQGGGDIEAAMKSRKVPVTLKAQRKKLKEQLQQSQGSQQNQQQATAQQAQAATENAAPTTGQLMQAAKDSGKLVAATVGDKNTSPAATTPAAPTPAKAQETPAKASGKKKPSADQTRAKADLMAALADLGDILGKNTRMNIMPEQEQKLLPVLTRVLDAAFRLGYHKFKDSAKFALDQIRAHLGDEAADALTLDHMQGAYIAMAGGKEGADTKRAVIDVESKAEIEAHEAKTDDEAQEDAAAAPDAKTLTESLYQAIGAGNMPKDNPALKKLVETFDGKPADPARMKQAQEELETAIAMSARDIVAKGQNDKATFDELLRLYESQPSLNIRTSTSVANQAYSTPAPLAFIASRLAGITRNTVAHEPTGGTGMLLIGADPKKALVNELNDLRISALKAQGFAPTQLDAASMRLVPDGVQPDAVVTNPPFGSIKDADGKPVKVKVDGYNIGQIDHLIAARALQSMKDDGKATLILGANKVAGGLSTDDRIFFNWLYSHYNVVGHFEVEGDLYSRQGAGWPVRVITINGRQKSSKFAPVAGTIQRADNWSQVYEQFTQSLDAAAKPATGEVGGGSAVAIEAPGAPGGRRPQGSTGSAGNVAGTGPRAVPDRAKPAAEPVAPVPDEQRLNAQSFVPQPQPGQNPSGAERPAKPAGNASLASPVAAAGNEFQTPYVPRSARKDEGVLIPSNMAQPTQDALNRLEDAVGDIDEFARKELGYESTEALHSALMGLQVDSVATAIYQIKQNKAVVIADQTGIGKGRQAASIIRWAARNGMIPVFVSVKPSLFTDMYGDLADIGTHDVAPFILNSTEWVSGADGEKLFANKPSAHRAAIQSIVDNAALPQGRNALFMTYSQINTANLQRQALMALAPNAVFVLDESHNAAGDSGTGDFMISVLKEARGVTYLSATYAKRPDNMPLYFKTDIGDAAADSEGLADAMAAGGLPLQTVVSNNLVKAGQMFRRERSYDGVSIASTFDTANRQLHERLSDEATEALRAIVSADKLFHSVFVKTMDKALKAEGSKVQDNAGNQVSAGVQHTEFSSVVHNFVRQMLLGLKAQTAADEAIASLKRGEKPIIAVENTMGSFLSEYAAQNNINQGDSLGAFDYRTVLSRALERSRVINVVLPTGDKSKQNIPLSQLDPITRKAYDQAQAVIDRLAIDIPVSPIDWMRAEIARAGFSVAEITGRDLAVDYSNPRKPVLSAIDLTEQRDKVASTRRFNGGELDALILNVAGSTGISLHASEKFADQRQRHMIVAQAAGDINIFMQMLGRVHRTGQVRLPKYTILSVDLPTEKRPTAVLSRKMKSLNANTSSNTESATSVKTADILNKYGDQIVNQYLVDNLELARQLGVDDILSSDGERVADDIARKATGRLALQPIEVQRAFYEDVEAQYDALIEYLNKTNQNDLEPRTFDFDAKEVRTEILFDGPNKTTPFGEDAVYGEYSIKAQGVAMKPEEIQAAIAESLQGKTGAEHARDLLNGLLQTYVEQTNAAMAQKVGQGATFDLDEYAAFLKPLFGEDGAARMMAQAQASMANGTQVGQLTVRDLSGAQGVGAGMEFLRNHAIGKTFRVEINSEPYNGVITNVRNTHKTTGNPFSLSKFQITLAVNGALRSITVPATQFRKIEVSSIAPAFRIETLFKEQPANQRETAKIVTGNLLAAYGEIKGARGTIISFTKADGVIEQGILLPKLFDFSKNTQGDYRLRSGTDALKFLQQSTNKDIGRFGIATRDGQVRVLPRGDGVQVRVPKSKAQGARYFLDKNLIAVAGDFVSSANAMVANVDDAASAVKVLDLLMDKQALYALPSMAEEAKSMAAKTATGDGAAFSRGRGLSAEEAVATFSRSPTTQAAIGTPAATIRAAITKAYGKLLGQLESKGLVTLTQTEDEAIEAAAQARAAKTGQPVEQARSTLRASVKNSVADQTQTENFQRWFKDSKVVDAEGKPLVVYHGTAGDFNAFDAAKSSTASMHATAYLGHYFSEAPEVANEFVPQREDLSTWPPQRGPKPGGNVMAVHLAIANPYEMPLAEFRAMVPYGRSKSGIEQADELRKRLEGQGYDGIRVAGDPYLKGSMQGDEWHAPTWIAFHPEQIKSATGNNGDFDPANPDIRRSADGAIQGFFDPQTGQSFLIADNLTAEAAPGVLMHEVGIHMAADGSMKALFNRAAMMLKLQKGNPFIKAVQARMDAAGETSGEEAAAYIAEAYENDRANAPASVQRWLADLLAAVKAWMFKKGIMGADRLTVADIAAVARANARSMARDGGATGWQGFGTAFSRAPAGDQTQTEAFKRGKNTAVKNKNAPTSDTPDAFAGRPNNGMQERAVRAVSGSPELTQFSEAGGDAHLSTLRAVDVFGDGRRIEYYDDAKGMMYSMQKYPRGERWTAWDVFPAEEGGRQVIGEFDRHHSFADAVKSIRGARISASAKARLAKYSAIPNTWDGYAKKLAKALIDAGVPIDRFSNSTQSRSKYIYLDDGRKIRLADHDLPSAYDSPDYDYRYGIGSIAQLVEQIKSETGNNGNFDRTDVRIDHFAAKQRQRQGSTVDRAVMDMAREGQPARDILRLISDTSKSRFNKQIARLLLKTGITPEVVFADTDLGGGDGFKFKAKYSRAQDRVTLTGEAAGQAEQIVLHELIHAATLKALDKPGLHSLQMRRLFEHVKRQGGAAGQYGMKNVGEFVAEAFTNPDFQQALRNISAPSGSVLKTAWDSFVRILRSILGLGNDTHSALSQALNLGVSVVREDMLIRKKGTRMGMRAEGGVDPDAKAAVALQQRVEGMSAQELAQFLASDNTPAQAAIARRVSERLTALQKQGVKFDFKVSHIGAFAPAAMNRARAYTEFEVDDKGQISVTVWAHGADMQGRVGMDKGTLLHELVHAVTGAALQAGRMHPDSAYRQSVGDLRKLHAALVEHIIDRRKRMGDGISEFEKSILEGANNAMQSEDEILAWGLTNPEMQSLLESMPYQGATGWGRFVQTIRNLLGLAPSADTGLSEVLRIADQIMSADPVETSELPNIAKSGMPMYSTQGTARRWGMAEQDGDGHVANFGTDDMARNIGDGLKSITVPNVKRLGKHKLTDWLKMGLQFLGRRQLVDIYGDLVPLAEYNRLAAQMEADKNESGAEADELVTRWAKLPDEAKLADLMHDATLAQIDPAKPYVDGDDKARYMTLQGRFNALSAEAKQVYTDTRDSYQAHHAKVRSAIKERIERSEIKGERKAALLKQMDDEFFKAIKGVYFPLARFGQYAVTVNGPDGKVESVSRAETKAEAEALRNNLLSAFPRDKGFTVGRVMLSKEFIADRDAVGRGFMTELYQVLDKQDMDAAQRAELEDTLGQLYLSSLPDLSWAKHGIHRKGTPGFSQDARRAFAQNMFHGARYLAKLRYSDLMQDQLAAMQKHVDDWREVEDFDQNSAQRVVDEMNKRHESLMNPKSSPLSTALTSFGFIFHLGLSPASALVNLSQTALVAYPIMGAKWGFGKASAALLKASQQAAKGKNDITGALNAEERAAYDEAVRAGTIDVTMAHDLAGIAQGEDAGVMWKIRPVMRWASFLFHHAERFNRQVTFVAAYRLAREAGADNKAAFEQATKATYDGHFDYSASNRARIMQGNVAKVLLLFKQYGQNMVYTLSRNAYQSINGTDAEKAEARKVLAGLLTSHAMAAGVLGLPMVTTLLAAASMIGGDDDEPWDAKVALQNLLADTFGQKPAEVLAHGLSRLTPWDISGRVGLDRLIFPDVQEGLEGQRLAESAMAAALGPVAGIGVNMLKGAQHMSEGRYALGLEAMLPSALRGPVKAIRYANEGVQDKSGISILDEVSPAAVAGQALGFSPSQARNAQEGKSAVMAHDRALGERRQELLTKAARATMAKDAEARAEAMKEIERFNQKNPTRRITPLNVLQSVRNRNKRIDQAQDGVYLPRNRRDAMDAGRFAFAGTD